MWPRRCVRFCFLYTCFRDFIIRFSCNLREARSGLLRVSFVLATMVSLRVWMSVRNVFASRVRFLCFSPRACVGVQLGESVGVSRGCVCWGWVLAEESTLEEDSCNADPTSFQARSARAWGGRFFVFLRISSKVERIVKTLRSKSSLSDFSMFPYFSFQEWYACRKGLCSTRLLTKFVR